MWLIGRYTSAAAKKPEPVNDFHRLFFFCTKLMVMESDCKSVDKINIKHCVSAQHTVLRNNGFIQNVSAWQNYTEPAKG